ncbi:MAG: T9SS type A sorting domain-containing protein [Ferruginibacter sp.]
MKTILNLSTKMTSAKACITSLLLMFVFQMTSAQNNYKNIQTNNLSEELNQSNNFLVSGRAASVSNFSLKDIEPVIQQKDFDADKTSGFKRTEACAVSAYSNPVDASGVATLKSKKPIQSICVLDLSGKLMMIKNIITTEGHGRLSGTINLNSLPAGIYIGQLTDVSGNTNNIKLIKRD